MPNHRKPRIQKVCANCGKPFEVRPSAAYQQFCSKQCGNNWGIVSRSVTKTCPTCGNSFRVILRDRERIFCSTTCANRRKYVDPKSKQCAQCGIEFTPSILRRHQQYCSHQCFLDSIKIQKRACIHCGNEFLPKRTEQQFCSTRCQQSAKRNRVTLTCGYCGNTFEATNARKSTRHYCSKQCQIKGRFHSLEEDNAVEIIADLLNESPLRQHNFDWLVSSEGRALFLDAYFPNHQIAVEYDGKQHREFMPFFHRVIEVFQRAQARDKEKELLLKQHGIKLIRIADNEPCTHEYLARRLGRR